MNERKFVYKTLQYREMNLPLSVLMVFSWKVEKVTLETPVRRIREVKYGKG